MSKTLHIVSFDIPYPANYGGVIDVYHKIRCLHNNGVKIILHCFKYGSKNKAKELDIYCDKIYYYERNTSFLNHFSLLPFNVKSRINNELKQNLLLDNYPILFEVLHTCYLLNDKELQNRKLLFRHSNIEHHYFKELAKAEKQFLKKIYLYAEAFKLNHFEKTIKKASCILAVSKNDLIYFKKKYPKTPSVYLPSFHEFDEIKSIKGKGNYILYHGNLSVSENYTAAIWLIKNVFSAINVNVIIAGLNPPQHLINLITKYPHISLQANCSEPQMQKLIANAHIHCLYTQQETGLKLKLLNVLFGGRFVLVNKQLLVGTNLNDACIVCNTANDFIKNINKLIEQDFNEQQLEVRKLKILEMNNQDKTNLLIDLM